MWVCPPGPYDGNGVSSSGGGRYENMSIPHGGGTPGGGNSHRHQPLILCATGGNSSEQSVSNDYDKFSSALSPTADILVACYLVLLEILAIFFNGFVIGLSIWKRKSLKASDSFVVYLALSDVGHPVISYPFIIASSFKHEWLFGDTGCLLNGFTGFFFGVNSMMTLAMMSLNRLLIITNANFARRYGKFIACGLICLSMTFALFWSLSPILGWGEYGPEPYKTSCTLVWHEPDRSFVTASFIGCLALPSFIMIYSYGKIVYLAAVMRHRRRKWVPRAQEMKLWEKNELRLLKVTGVMCFTFLLFWTPYAIVAMIKSYASHIYLPVEVSIIPAMAAKTSHVADPLIYCALNRNFNQHMPVLFRKISKSSRFSESYFTTQSLRLKTLMAVDGKVNDSSDMHSV